MNDTDRKVIIKEVTSRKEKKEQKAYSSMLLYCVNKFLIAEKDKTLNTLLTYRLCNNEWKTFVIKWNNNPKRDMELRLEDFQEVIKKHKEDGKN